MSDLIQYGAASATSLHKRLQRDAGVVKRAGAGGKKSIVEGYIVSTVVTGSGTLTKVVDTPAFLATGQAAQVEATGDAHDTMAFAVGDRDLYTPASAVTPPVATLSEGSASEFYVTGCTYVGDVPSYPALESAKSNQLGNAWVDGEYIYNARVAVFEDEALLRDVGHIVLHGAGWASKAYKLSAGPSTVAPSRWTEQALVIAEDAVRAAAGDTGLTLAPVLAGGVVVAPVLRAVVLGTDAYTAVTAYDYAGGVKATLFIAKTALAAFDPLVRNRPGAFTWTSARVGLPPGAELTVPVSSGLHVAGGVVTAGLSYRWDDIDARATKTVLYSLDAASGSVTGTSVIAEDTSPSDSREHVWFTTAVAQGLLFVRYTYDHVANVIANHELRMAVGTTVVPSGLAAAGWVPWYKALPGTPPSVGVLVLAYPSVVACDLGGGRIGVIACATGSRTAGDTITWHLIELDAVTLAYVADRGPIGVMVYQPTLNQRVSITLVTPQTVVSGVVERQAVLLATLVAGTATASRITRLSTDGGATWKQVANGVGTDLFYVGNKLHPVRVGGAL